MSRSTRSFSGEHRKVRSVAPRASSGSIRQNQMLLDGAPRSRSLEAGVAAANRYAGLSALFESVNAADQLTVTEGLSVSPLIRSLRNVPGAGLSIVAPCGAVHI